MVSLQKFRKGEYLAQEVGELNDGLQEKAW